MPEQPEIDDSLSSEGTAAKTSTRCDGMPTPERAFVSSAFAIADFVCDGAPSIEELSTALEQAVAVIGHALEAASLGLVLEADPEGNPRKYVVRS